MPRSTEEEWPLSPACLFILVLSLAFWSPVAYFIFWR